jgi:hypothetical protein
MTTLEQAARQALEAMKEYKRSDDDRVSIAMNILQADLAETSAKWQEIECPCCGDLARAFPPAPKHQWVGLTDDNALWEMWVESSSSVFLFARAIENKLKKKNA